MAGAATAGARAARCNPGRAAAAAARHLDRRRHGRQSERRSGHDRRRTRARPDARARPPAAGCARAGLGVGNVHRARGPSRARFDERRAVPFELVRIGSGSQPTSTATPKSSRPTSPASTPRFAPTAPPGSPTAPSPISVRVSRCSDCTWRRSISASTRRTCGSSRHVVAAFTAAAEARERHGPRSIDRVIVSMTASAGDVLAAETLARAAGLTSTPCRCSRRSTTSAVRESSPESSSTGARGRASR